SLLTLLKKYKNKETEEVPEGMCPGCWGRQEYAGKFYDAVKNHTADINENTPNKGWIQDYADKNLSKIQLNKIDDSYVCQKSLLQHPL
ncbi:hypothetical protein, partial [uncultured Kiloniella sp.]|uniref:hypothetical protein n=1 Tax=uncultured Kiloniella sp. TaxID=1133091 RepID=UPI00261C1B82